MSPKKLKSPSKSPVKGPWFHIISSSLTQNKRKAVVKEVVNKTEKKKKQKNNKKLVEDFSIPLSPKVLSKHRQRLRHRLSKNLNERYFR